MRSAKVADLHSAFDRLESEFMELPEVLTGQGDVFSAGIDFEISGIDSCAWVRSTKRRRR